MVGDGRELEKEGTGMHSAREEEVVNAAKGEATGPCVCRRFLGKFAGGQIE